MSFLRRVLLGPQVPTYIPFLSALWAGCLASLAKPKPVSVFIAFFYLLPQTDSEGKEGIRVRKTTWVKEQYNLNKSTKCFKEIDPQGIKMGPGFCLTQGLGILEG